MNPTIDTDLPFHAIQTAGHTGRSCTVTTIESTRPWFSLQLRDLWTYRELLGFLVWRDVKVRYQQTLLGAAWALLQPFLTMLLFSVLFGRLAKLPSDHIPYPLFVYTALLPWQLFSFALTESSNSLVGNQNLIRKVYFPRLIIPTASVLVGLVDFAISLGVLGGMMAWYGVRPAGTTLLFIPFVLLTILTALGIGLWLSALNIQYRDVRYVVPFLTQFWMFATPVAYSSSLVPKEWQTLYRLNPMAGVVDGFRWALLGTHRDSGGMLVVTVAAVLILVLSGLIWFRRMEKSFADLV